MSNDILEKGRRFPIGTIHNGFKKVAEGKWRKVSEYGMTKEEHQDKSEKMLRGKGLYNKERLKTHTQNEEMARNLDSKEYSDTEVMGEDNKDNIQKALTTLEIGYLSGEVDKQTIISARISAEDLEKGRKANIGEIRDWKGGKYRKTSDGWVAVSERK